MIRKNPTGFEIFGPKYWTGVVTFTRENTAAVLVNRRDPDPKYTKRKDHAHSLPSFVDLIFV